MKWMNEWKNTTSWMIQMGQASTRGVNFFATVITNILNYSKISISIFQITKNTKSTTDILSIVNCTLQQFLFSVLFIYMYLFIPIFFFLKFYLLMRDKPQMSRNKFVQNWCVNSLCEKCEIILNNKVFIYILSRRMNLKIRLEISF